MKYAICPVILLPLILMGMMPFCLGGFLRVGLTIPIVAFCSQFPMYVENLPSFWYVAILFLIPGIC